MASGLVCGAIPAQPGWTPLDGPSQASVLAVTAIDSVLLASDARRIYRSVGAEAPWIDTVTPEYAGAEFLQAVDSLVFAASGPWLFRSADRGRTWSRSQGKTDTALPRRIFRSRGSLTLATTDGSYLSSADHGLTWTPFQNSPSGYAFTKVLIQDSLIYAGTDNGLYVSANQGGSWRRLRGGLPAAGQILLLERELGRLFTAIVGQGLFVSNDDGTTWAKVDGGLARAGVEYMSEMGMAAGRNLLLMATSGPGGVLGSRDSGKNWTPLNQGLPTSRFAGSTRYAPFAVGFLGDTALVATSEGIFRSVNGGAQWSSANQGLPPANDAYLSLAMVGAEAYAAFFGAEGSPAYRSRDGGTTWQKADTLLDALRMIRTAGNEWFAMTDRGMVRSTDGGGSWAILPGPWNPDGFPITFDLRGSDLAVAHDNLGYALSYSLDKGATWTVEVDGRPDVQLGGRRFQAAANRLRVSTDGGGTWAELPMEFPESVHALHAAGGSLALLSGTALFVSADSGRTWTRPGGLLEGVAVNALAEARACLYAATAKGLMLSRDGGRQWQLLTVGLPMADILALAGHEGRLFAADMHGLHLREGTAPGWRTLPSAPAGIRHLAAWKRTVLAATHRNRLWMSLDAGSTWTATGDTMPAQPVLALALGPDAGYVSRGNGMYRTLDTGKTWEPVLSVDLIPAPTSLAYGGDHLYAVSGIQAYRSRDGGRHWSSLPVPQGWRPRLLAVEGGILYAADDNGAHASSDLGETWSWDMPRFSIDHLSGLVSTGGRIYVAGPWGSGLKFLEAAPAGLRAAASGNPEATGIRLETAGGAAAFRFDLQGNGWVSWETYTASGRRVERYVSRRLAPGTYAFPLRVPEGRAGLLYRAEIRLEGRGLEPRVRMGRLLP